MAYGEKVIDHYQNPRNVGTLDKSKSTVGTGLVGAPECGDVMRLQIEIEDGIITDAKFKTFGCGSAIAASSLATEWLKGKSVDEAAKLDNMELDPIQQAELDRLNKALANQSIQPEDKKKLTQKKFNPQTGELQLYVDNGNGGVRLASVNIFE